MNAETICNNRVVKFTPYVEMDGKQIYVGINLNSEIKYDLDNPNIKKRGLEKWSADQLAYFAACYAGGFSKYVVDLMDDEVSPPAITKREDEDGEVEVPDTQQTA